MSPRLITDYLRRGVLAQRPVAPNVLAGETAIYTATDVGHVYIWSGAAWVVLL